jgi:hypothetical protein
VSLKSSLGLDWFDLLIHAGITAMLMVVAGSAASGGGEEAGISLVVAGSLGLLAWRRARAVRRGLVAPSGEDRPEGMAELEHRVAQLEAEQGRVLELEERLEFAERLLTQQREREAGRLPLGGGR